MRGCSWRRHSSHGAWSAALPRRTSVHVLPARIAGAGCRLGARERRSPPPGARGPGLRRPRLPARWASRTAHATTPARRGARLRALVRIRALPPRARGTAAENYSIAIPPPNVTGALHMGHALNGSIQDTLIRSPACAASATKWILGTDHAGIATQTQVEKLLAQRGHEPRGDRPRGVRRARVALARAVRRHDHRPVQAPRRLLRLRATSASRSTRPTRGRAAGLRRPSTKRA